jgi:cytochrome c oxidase cbb3-type subunit 2
MKPMSRNLASHAGITGYQQAQDSLFKQARERDFDGLPGQITEMEALVAYLQVLGTMVDFTKYDEGYFSTFR